MRVRPLALLVAIFGSAALVSWFVVAQFPREGELSPLPPLPPSTAPAEASPPLEPAATAADGTVEVRVSAGPEPLGGASVRLYAAPAREGEPWRRAGDATTDRAGVARVPAPAGAYLAVARAPGLAPGRAEVVRTAGDGATRVELVLELPATLEGRASARGGSPVSGARVRLVPLVSRWPGFAAPSAPGEEVELGTTDAAGAFRLAGLPPGSFALLLDAAGYHPVLLPRVPVPGDAVAVAVEPLGGIEGAVLLADGRPAAGAAVRVASADHAATATTGADGRYRLAAPAGSYTVSATLGALGGTADALAGVAAGTTARAEPVRLAAAARVEGTVTRAAGGPAAGAAVALFAHGSRDLVAQATAGGDGRFALGAVAPGAYELRAAAAGASPALLAGVTVAAGERFAARLVLPGTGEVAGTVRDEAGQPLAGVRVRVVQRGDGLAAQAPVEARTDFEGRFRITGLEVGRAELIARHDAVQIGVSRAVQVTEGRTAELELALPESGVLTGRATAGGKAPPPGTAVLAVAMRAGPGTLQVARATTDPRGGYVLPLPAGEYRVHAAPGLAARTDLRVAPAFARVEPARTSRLDLAVAPAVAERGPEILVLEPGGAPSPGATVTLARADDGRIALATAAGEDGRVALDVQMGIAGRAVTIRARNGGRAGATTATLGESGTVVVRLAPGGAVAGRVRGARAGFTLEISSQPAADGWRTVDVHRFAGERFELADLPPEPLRLVVRAADGRRGTAELRVAPGETRAIEIALR